MNLSPALQQCLAAAEAKESPEAFERLYEACQTLMAEQKAPEPPSGEVGPAQAALVRWVRQKGGHVHPGLALEARGDAGSGWMARAGSVAEGELLFRIPPSCIVTEETILADRAFAKVYEQLTVLRQFPSALLALFLVVEEGRGSKSAWVPYLACLPRSYSIPLFWTWEELLLLRGGPGWTMAQALWKNAVRLYAVCWRACSSHGKALGLRGKPPSFVAWRRALAAVFTRRNALPSAASAASSSASSGAEGRLALVPCWDMCNHAEGPLSTGMDPTSGAVVCQANASVSMGEEVTICYGPRSWADLLIHNGFLPISSLPFGPHDYFPLRLALNSNDPLFSDRAAFLNRAHGLPPAADYALRAFAPSCAALAFARVARLAAPIPSDPARGLALQPMSSANERDACQLLSMAVAVALRRLTAPLPLEEGASESYPAQCCRRLRFSERALLEQFHADLQSYQATLAAGDK